MEIELYPHQKEALKKLHNGSILCGGVGSGKSRTALAYYISDCGGEENGMLRFPRDLFIITTAKKRDSLEWVQECAHFCLSIDPDISISKVTVTVDSWNNIPKYSKVYGAFFIFDEQRVVGNGTWVKSFLKIANKNHWILLSATPGDTWSDYIPVFVANGFYKNKTDFARRHIIYDRFAKYPKIDRYIDTGILARYRASITVNMKDDRQTIKKHIDIQVDYDRELYRSVLRDRWDPYDNLPIAETGKLFYLLRRVVNSDPSRIEETRRLVNDRDKTIIFYNFTYELFLLRQMLDEEEIPFAEWNGQKHEEIPETDRWAYLVQYAAGSEGWNCIETDTIIFFSQNYSYRMMVQAAGRIDRINTPFKELYFYHLRSMASIDVAIKRALNQKRNFNEKRSKIG